LDIQPATQDMFDEIHPVLSEFGGALTRDDWKRLLDYRFSARPHRGWVARVNGEVVGYLGAIFSERAGAHFCCLTSWIVKAAHRKGNLRLLAPMFELKDHTLLNLSASPFTAALFQRLGFSVLDTHVLIIPPITPRDLRPRHRAVTELSELERMLGPTDRQFFSDHRPYPLTHLVLEGDGARCYVVASKTRFKRVPVSYLHHVSDPQCLAQGINTLQRALWRTHRTLFTLVDRRLMGPCRIRGSLPYRLAQPRLYRPAAPAPGGIIDSLYTELALLNPARWTFVH
jgi:hypothetical protein